MSQHDVARVLVVDDEPVRTLELQGPQLYELIETGNHEQHEIKLRFRNEALAYGFSFGPGMPSGA